MRKIALTLSLTLSLFLPATANPQSDPTSRSWNQPVKPYRIIGNIWYVGASGVTSFLITTPEGHILLDSGLPETVPQIKQNVAQLGFKLTDIKVLLNSHAQRRLPRSTRGVLFDEREDGANGAGNETESIHRSGRLPRLCG